MRLLFAALPMVGCALMMLLMMRTMGGGARRTVERVEPEPADERRDALEAEAAALRARIADRETKPT